MVLCPDWYLHSHGCVLWSTPSNRAGKDILSSICCVHDPFVPWISSVSDDARRQGHKKACKHHRRTSERTFAWFVLMRLCLIESVWLRTEIHQPFLLPGVCDATIEPVHWWC